MNSWIIEVGSGIFLSSLDQPFLEGEVNLHNKPYLKAIISATEKLKFFVIIVIEVLFDSNYSDNSTPPVCSSHMEREKGILHFYRVEEDVSVAEPQLPQLMEFISQRRRGGKIDCSISTWLGAAI